MKIYRTKRSIVTCETILTAALVSTLEVDTASILVTLEDIKGTFIIVCTARALTLLNTIPRLTAASEGAESVVTTAVLT